MSCPSPDPDLQTVELEHFSFCISAAKMQLLHLIGSASQTWQKEERPIILLNGHGDQKSSAL